MAAEVIATIQTGGKGGKGRREKGGGNRERKGGGKVDGKGVGKVGMKARRRKLRGNREGEKEREDKWGR